MVPLDTPRPPPRVVSGWGFIPQQFPVGLFIFDLGLFLPVWLPMPDWVSWCGRLPDQGGPLWGGGGRPRPAAQVRAIHPPKAAGQSPPRQRLVCHRLGPGGGGVSKRCRSKWRKHFVPFDVFDACWCKWMGCGISGQGGGSA